MASEPLLPDIVPTLQAAAVVAEQLSPDEVRILLLNAAEVIETLRMLPSKHEEIEVQDQEPDNEP